MRLNFDGNITLSEVLVSVRLSVKESDKILARLGRGQFE
jgi:hypothetical protein